MISTTSHAFAAPAWAVAIVRRKNQVDSQRAALFAAVSRNVRPTIPTRQAESLGDLRSPVEPVERVSAHVRPTTGKTIAEYFRRKVRR